MRFEIKIPQMGESITEATIGKILKLAGESVEENEEVIELETAKVNQLLYAPAKGVVSWNVKEGQEVKIGELIGVIESEGAVQQQKSSEKPEPQHKPSKEMPRAQEAPGSGQRLFAEAFVQELKQPLQKEAEKPFPSIKESVSDGRETRRSMTKIRKTIAERLITALHSSAMLTTFNEVDMSEVLHLRTKYKELFIERHGVKLGFMSFFVKAVVESLKLFPNFNSYIERGEIVKRHYYDLGIAVGTDRGLVVPVVRGCDRLTFPEIEQEIVQYAKKAREGKLSIADLEGGGFTITNGGVYGSLLSTPLLNPPQVGILGMHKIVKRPVVVEDKIEIRPMMYVALSYDHCLIDGKEAVSFLMHIKELLEEPSRFYLSI